MTDEKALPQYNKIQKLTCRSLILLLELSIKSLRDDLVEVDTKHPFIGGADSASFLGKRYLACSGETLVAST